MRRQRASQMADEADSTEGQMMTGPACHDQATAGAPRRRRPYRVRPATAGLAVALAAALAIPALTVAGGAAMAAASGGTAAQALSADRASAGRSATAGITAAGTTRGFLRAWGLNNAGQLGNGSTANADVPVKVKLPSGTRVTQVRAGCFHTVALTSKGHVLAWGENANGQLGNGTTTDSTTPVRVKLPSGTKVTAVRAGCLFSLALTSKDHVLAWGYNGFGQLGNDTTTDSETPVRVKLPAGTKATAISAGQNFSLARTSKGHALTWGQNNAGQLGNATTTNSDTPVRVKLPAGSKVQILTAGYNFAFVSVSGGGVFVWGANNLGQFGDGTTTSSDIPVSIGPMHFGPMHGGPTGHVVSLVAGCGHALALFSGGAIFSWGANDLGQLGNGTTTSSLTPVTVQLPAGTKVTAISAACDDGYALTVKGHVLAWGYNGQGALGDDASTDSDTPVRVDLPSGRRAVALGAGPLAEHALAIVRKKS